MRNDRRRLVAIAVAALIAPCAQASQTGPATGKTWSNVITLAESPTFAANHSIGRAS